MKMRKWTMLAVAVLLLVIFRSRPGLRQFLKQPLGKEDRLLEAVQSIEQHVEKKNWKQAKDKVEYASNAWRRIVNRIQYSVEREYMYDISGILSRIRGGIVAKDDASVMEEVYFSTSYGKILDANSRSPASMLHTSVPAPRPLAPPPPSRSSEEPPPRSRLPDH